MGFDAGSKITQKHVNQLASGFEQDIQNLLLKNNTADIAVITVNFVARSSGSDEVKQLIRSTILSVLSSGENVEVDGEFSITLDRLPIQGSPIAELPGEELSNDHIRAYLQIELAKENPHCFCVASSKYGAVIVLFESNQNNKLIKNLFVELKSAAKNQLTGDRPGVLFIKFQDITSAEMLRLSDNSGDTIETATGLQAMTSAFFMDRRFDHVLAVCYMATEEVYFDQSPGGIALPGTTQGHGQTYTFYNENCPQHSDARYSLR